MCVSGLQVWLHGQHKLVMHANMLFYPPPYLGKWLVRELGVVCGQELWGLTVYRITVLRTRYRHCPCLGWNRSPLPWKVVVQRTHIWIHTCWDLVKLPPRKLCKVRTDAVRVSVDTIERRLGGGVRWRLLHCIFRTGWQGAYLIHVGQQHVNGYFVFKKFSKVAEELL
jgi:hypothetical protein